MSDFRYWLRASYTAMTASVLFLFSSSAAAEEDEEVLDLGDIKSSGCVVDGGPDDERRAERGSSGGEGSEPPAS